MGGGCGGGPGLQRIAISSGCMAPRRARTRACADGRGIGVGIAHRMHVQYIPYLVGSLDLMEALQ